MAAPTSTTSLEAVNQMLAVTGDAPLTSLSGTLSKAGTVAVLVLNQTLAEFESEGWSFNTEKEKTYTASASVSPTIAGIDVSQGFETQDLDLVLRGDTLFNRARGQNSAVTSGTYTVDIIRYLDFEDTPQTFRRWVVASASRRLYDRVTNPDGRSNAILVREELLARNAFLADEGRNADYNIFNNASVGRANRVGPLDRYSW